MSGDSRRQLETLVDQKDALSVYFDALLREAPPVEEPAPAPVQTPAPVTTPVETPAVVAATYDDAAPQPADVRPAWGEGRFQAMLFKVAGLTLAVPLSELHGIRECDQEKVTSMPGHVAWYLGLMTYRGRQVPVIDTAQLVLPDERRSALTEDPFERIERVVFIGDGGWGLGCDQVNEVISLEPDEVRWRTERTRRRWLAGTVIKHMCALLDPGAFAQMLAAGARDMALQTEDGSGA